MIYSTQAIQACYSIDNSQISEYGMCKSNFIKLNDTNLIKRNAITYMKLYDNYYAL